MAPCRDVWGQGAGRWERKEGQGHQAFSWGREETLGRVWCRAAPRALSVPLSRAPHTADCACEAGVGYGEEERSRWPPVGKLFILQSHRRRGQEAGVTEWEGPNPDRGAEQVQDGRGL